MIVVDPGHGMGNRQPGVFDPGIVGVGGLREADLTMQYGVCLATKLTKLGYNALLTRRDNEEECSLARRVQLAKQVAADFLISIHFNGDADPGNALQDGKLRGFQVLHRFAESNPASLAGLHLAYSIADAMKQHVRTHGSQPVVDRQDLYVLHYHPSCLLEVCFLDDPEDAVLAASEPWMNDAMQSVAEAISACLNHSQIT